MSPKSKKSKKLWVSASNLKNYMVKDQLVDWLKMYYDPTNMKKKSACAINKYRSKKKKFWMKLHSKTEKSLSCVKKIINKKRVTRLPSSDNIDFEKFIMAKGCQFEKDIIAKISKRNPIVHVSEIYHDKYVKETISLMKKGVPIIHSAPIRNDKDNTFGIIDLLVRSDYLSRILTVNQDDADKDDTDQDDADNAGQDAESTKGIPDKPFYVVIDIKYSTIPLRADGQHILNSQNYPAYKSQLLIYNRAIGNIQGYEPSCAYIIGRAWKYTSKGEKYKNNDPLSRLGVVNFQEKDFLYKERTNLAIDWYRDVALNGHEWNVYPPSKRDLYPNMCVGNSAWGDVKKDIATKCHDITMIWQCGVGHRDKAFESGVISYKDEKCNAELMGFKNKRADTVDKIININTQRSNKIVMTNTVDRYTKTLLEDAIDSKFDRSVQNFYVDFETMSCIFFDDADDVSVGTKTNTGSFLYMIGIYTAQDGYRCFLAESLSPEDEYINACNFIKYINALDESQLSSLWHYSNAEVSIWNDLVKRHDRRSADVSKLEIMDDRWVDLLHLLKHDPIVIKGSFNFSLKSVARAMHDHGFISDCWNGECDNGLDSMLYAWQYYKGSIGAESSVKKIEELIKYNMVDCKVIFEILEFLYYKFI